MDGYRQKKSLFKFPLGETLPVPTDCPVDLWSIIIGCFELDPHRRPSFEKLLEQLSAYKANQLQSPSKNENTEVKVVVNDNEPGGDSIYDEEVTVTKSRKASKAIEVKYDDVSIELN